MKLLKKFLFVLTAGLIAGPALAAVDLSHHDLRAWAPATSTEVCLYCHGIVSTVANSGNYGEVGELCLARCHSGAGYVAASVQPSAPAYIDNTGTVQPAADSVTAVNVVDGAGAHGLELADLLSPIDIAGTVLEPFTATGTALPYGAGPIMECTTCHDVHNNTYTPFLQRPLFTGGAVATESFCEACHSLRGASFTGAAGTNTVINPTGEHPVNVALTFGDVTAAARAVGGTTNPRTGRYIALDGAVFDVVSDKGATLNSNASHYSVGGHVGGGATPANDFTAFDSATDNGKVFGCYSCHSPHSPIVAGRPHLLLGAPISADGQWNPLCVGCHGDSATAFADDPNPGLAASAYFHPANSSAPATTGAGVGPNVYVYPTSTGTFTFQVNLNDIITLGVQSIAPQSSGINIANGGRPRCTSCHDIHGGISDSMSLVDLQAPRTGGFTGKICDECHGAEGLPDVADDRLQAGEAANSHHRTSTWNLAAATEADADTNSLIMDPPSWSGIQGSDGMGCADCHVFSGGDHSTAHNW